MIKELSKDIYIGGNIKSRKEAQLLFANRIIDRLKININEKRLNHAIDVVTGIQKLDTDFVRIYKNLVQYSRKLSK